MKRRFKKVLVPEDAAFGLRLLLLHGYRLGARGMQLRTSKSALVVSSGVLELSVHEQPDVANRRPAGHSFWYTCRFFHENFRAPRVARYGRSPSPPIAYRPKNREITKSKLRNREIGSTESRNHIIAKSSNCRIAESRNRELGSEIDIGNMPRQLESEIAIWNQKHPASASG